MTTDFKNLTQLTDFFTSEDFCKSWYENQRWGANVVCPHCNHDKVYRTTRGFKCANNTCYKKFSVTVGTIFENSKIPLRTWFQAMYLVSVSKKGISSIQLAETLGITQKTSWFVLSRIRTMLTENAPEKLTGHVEIDETYVGGKDANRHASKKQSKDWYNQKTPMVGLLERGGNVVLKVVEPGKLTHAKINSIVTGNVDTSATISTDGHRAYNGLGNTYASHGVVNHAKGEYVRGAFHTNNIEGFWATMKRGIYGVYHNVSAKHLDLYCNEFGYRYNNRTGTGVDKFEGAIQKVDSTRITYKQLIRK
ncbi:MAG TPA: IS1595 family transposase [Saprospiraceae bacterium]|nr:IS1595 family transposase [Saprospiraceae bacterium]